MGRECSPIDLARLSDAHYAYADLRKDIWRVLAYEKGKSIWRLLGAGLPHHGRHTAPPTTTREGLHQANPITSGLFTAEKINSKTQEPTPAFFFYKAQP